MVLQNYQNFIEMTSNMIYIVAFGGGLKCLRKIHLNTQWRGAMAPQILAGIEGKPSLQIKLAPSDKSRYFDTKRNKSLIKVVFCNLSIL